MTPRERFITTLLFGEPFGEPDRVPLEPGGGRESTRKVWHSQGLPGSIKPREIPEYVYREVGGRFPWPESGEGFTVVERMIPQFEEKIIEEKESSRIVQDWKGNICEIGKEYSPVYLRKAIDFVTRSWIRCPVESRDDWERMKERYDPEDPSRLPPNTESLGKRLEERNWVVGFSFSGPFWQLREWVGFERLCLLFYDDPDLVRDMIDFWKTYVGRLLERAFEHFTPDYVHLSEDMAYKEHPMISPDMVREFILPTYCHWGELIRSSGCPIYAMDSDGYIADLIPIWMEAGINACDPIEVAAGNDLVLFREEFGRKMAYRGGVDKRAMAKGGAVLETEIRRVLPVVKSGGYIPGCDHGIPPDVSWENYLAFVRLLAEATGWL